jgi:hypothetical protein
MLSSRLKGYVYDSVFCRSSGAGFTQFGLSRQSTKIPLPWKLEYIACHGVRN